MTPNAFRPPGLIATRHLPRAGRWRDRCMLCHTSHQLVILRGGICACHRHLRAVLNRIGNPRPADHLPACSGCGTSTLAAAEPEPTRTGTGRILACPECILDTLAELLRERVNTRRSRMTTTPPHDRSARR